MGNQSPPVITIDGPSGAGKGTVAQLLARSLNWHFLDSGAIYRAFAVAVELYNVSSTEEALFEFALSLSSQLTFTYGSENEAGIQICWANYNITEKIRQEKYGQLASQFSVIPTVREALIDCQRSFRQLPGLVADGRDMGTLIFPDAILKIFLTASLTERAKRRYLELKGKGIDVSLEELYEALLQRDYRDKNRAVAPLIPAADGHIIDTTLSSVAEVLEKINVLLKLLL